MSPPPPHHPNAAPLRHRPPARRTAQVRRARSPILEPGPRRCHGTPLASFFLLTRVLLPPPPVCRPRFRVHRSRQPVRAAHASHAPRTALRASRSPRRAPRFQRPALNQPSLHGRLATLHALQRSAYLPALHALLQRCTLCTAARPATLQAALLATLQAPRFTLICFPLPSADTLDAMAPRPRSSRAPAGAHGSARAPAPAPAAFALLLAAAFFTSPRAAAADRLGSCGIDSVCQNKIDAVAGDYSSVWPGAGSILEGLLQCVPSGDSCGDWPLYHAVADPGRGAIANQQQSNRR